MRCALFVWAWAVLAGYAGTPTLILESGGHTAKVAALAFSPDGACLYSAGYDGSLRTWDLANGGTLAAVWRGPDPEARPGRYYALAVAPGGDRLAAAGYLGEDAAAGLILERRLPDGKLLARRLGHANVVQALAYTPDGSLLVSGSEDGTVRLWPRDPAAAARSLATGAPVRALAIAPDGRCLATLGPGGGPRLWDLATLAPLASAATAHGDGFALVFAHSGQTLYSGGDGGLWRWDLPLGEARRESAAPARVWSLAASPAGLLLAGGWGAGQGADATWPAPAARPLPWADGAVSAVALDPAGKLAALGSGLGAIAVYATASGQRQVRLAGAARPLVAVGFRRDGRALAWGSGEPTGDAWARGALEQVFEVLPQPAAAGGVARVEDFGRGLPAAAGLSLRLAPDGAAEIGRGGLLQARIPAVPERGVTHRSLTLSPDGRRVFSGGAGGELAAYDSASGRRLFSLHGHRGEIWGLAPSPDGRYLASVAADGTLRLWLAEDGRLLLSLFPGAGGEWAAWSPEGRYACSGAGDRYLGWALPAAAGQPARFLPAPCLGSRFQDAARLGQFVAAAGHLPPPAGDSPAALFPPALRIEQPAASPWTTTAAELELVASAEAVNDLPVTDIVLRVNGSRVRGLRLVSSAAAGRRAVLRTVVPLAGERTRLTLVARNAAGESEEQVLEVRRPAAAAGPALYVLAVGVSAYPVAGLGLDSAAADARALAALFAERGPRLFARVQTRTLLDGQASREAILDGLDWLVKSCAAGDLAVVFLAGHGLRDERGDYYFLPGDGDPERLRSRALKWLAFHDALAALPGPVLLLADTCHSAGLAGPPPAGSPDAPRPGRLALLSAAGPREWSQENPAWGHGAFSLALLEALGGGGDGTAVPDTNRNNRIELDELARYVSWRVTKLTSGHQHPLADVPPTMPSLPLLAY